MHNGLQVPCPPGPGPGTPVAFTYALYLASGLLVTRTAASARTEPGLMRRLFGSRPR
jgi:hypothetical protein